MGFSRGSEIFWFIGLYSGFDAIVLSFFCMKIGSWSVSEFLFEKFVIWIFERCYSEDFHWVSGKCCKDLAFGEI